MKVIKLMPVDQNSEQMEELVKLNGTTTGICGFITTAVCDYLSSLQNFNVAHLQKLNSNILRSYIDQSMKTIIKRRRMEIKKYFNVMSDPQKKAYIKDYVANYEIADYLEGISDKMVNKQVYFFRNVAFDHPAQMENIKYEQKQRVLEEQMFKGKKVFYSSFGPYTNHYQEDFIKELKNINKEKPVIIATDILGHYNVTILMEGQVYILDSLSSYLETRFDSTVTQSICTLYQKSYLIQ